MVVDSIFVGDNHKFLTHVEIIDLKHIHNLPDGDVTMSKGKDPLEEFGGPMTRTRVRKAKEALQQV